MEPKNGGSRQRKTVENKGRGGSGSGECTTNEETVGSGGIYKIGGEAICFLRQLTDLMFMILLSVN